MLLIVIITFSYVFNHVHYLLLHVPPPLLMFLILVSFFFVILIMVIVFSYAHVVDHGCLLLVFMLLIMVVTFSCVINHVHPPQTYICSLLQNVGVVY